MTQYKALARNSTLQRMMPVLNMSRDRLYGSPGVGGVRQSGTVLPWPLDADSLRLCVCLCFLVLQGGGGRDGATAGAAGRGCGVLAWFLKHTLVVDLGETCRWGEIMEVAASMATLGDPGAVVLNHDSVCAHNQK